MRHPAPVAQLDRAPATGLEVAGSSPVGRSGYRVVLPDTYNPEMPKPQKTAGVVGDSLPRYRKRTTVRTAGSVSACQSIPPLYAVRRADSRRAS